MAKSVGHIFVESLARGAATSLGKQLARALARRTAEALSAKFEPKTRRAPSERRGAKRRRSRGDDTDAEAVAKFVSDSATGEIRDEIAAALGIPKADLVKILDRLIASGRIERSGFRSNSRGLRRFVYVAGKARDRL